jgi:hypothetical protein
MSIVPPNAGIKRPLHRSGPLEWLVRTLRPELAMTNCAMPRQTNEPKTPRFETGWLAENRNDSLSKQSTSRQRVAERKTNLPTAQQAKT